MILKKEWKIAPQDYDCASCLKKFDEQQLVISVLEAQGEFLQRKDYCENCWEKDSNQKLIFSRWSKIFSSKKKKTMDPEELKEIFESLIKKREESQELAKKRQGLIYLVALFLVRKRIYKMSDTYVKNNAEFIKVTLDDGSKYEIEIPDITPEELDELKEDFSRLFEA